MHPDVVKALSDARRNLATTEIPTSQSPGDKDRHAIRMAVSAFNSLLSCGRQHNLPDLQGLWPDIHAWMVFLDSHCGTDSVYTKKLRAPDLQAASLQVIPSIIMLPFTQRQLQLCGVIAATPDILSMCARRWMEDETGRQLNWGLALGQMVLAVDCMSHGALDGIVEATGRGVDGVAQVALTRVRNFPRDSPLNYRTTAPHLQLISAFLSTKHEMQPLHSAMLYHKLFPVLVDALKLTNNDTLSGESPPRDLYIKFCYSSIHAAMKLANGAALIAHALDVGLLSAILKSGARLRRLPPSFQDMMGQTLFGVLRQYLPYRSFLRSVSRALRKVDRLNISEENAGPLWDHWMEFHVVATAKLMIKEEFDQTHPFENMIGCRNEKCPDKDSEEVMRCSSCLSSVYCSRTCQKEDWPNHRLYCKETQTELRDGRSMPMHLHDLRFVAYQSVNDFSKQRVIINDIRANWPAPDQQTLCIQLDYSEVPPKFLVRPVSEFDWKPGYQAEDIERNVQKAREAYEEFGKRICILSVVLRQGYLENIYLMLLNIDADEEWEGEGLYGI